MHASPHVAAILEHQDFVRRLARGLIADPGAADDVAQDTWLSYLQNPPRAAAALTGWLGTVVRHRAHNQRREAARRLRREAAVARPEVVADDAPQERLELQQRVVTAVLALEEPYRKALLLHYYDGLSAAAIAERMRIPAGTVRSHISRALTRLRTQLDAQDECDGRTGWRRGLLLLAAPPAGLTLKAGVLASAALLCLAAAATGIWIARAETAVPAAAPATTVAATATDSGNAGAALAVTAPPDTPLLREPIQLSPDPWQDPALTQSSIADLQARAAWIQHLLRKRMLTADPDEIGVELAALRGVADTGATRLLRREHAEFALSEPLGVRGGGAYFSFATGSHSYDDEPDLSLEHGHFGASFYGGTVGLILPIGDTPLAKVGEAMPDELPAEQAGRWARLWQPASGADGKIDEAWASAMRADSRPVLALLERTYVLRRVAAGEHDVLVAFRPVAKDDQGQTIVYRVLKRFSTGEGRNHMPKAPVGTPPAELLAATAPELLQRLADLRAQAEPRLLAVAGATRQAWAGVLARPDTGIARILPRGRFDALVASRGGGAYFDFIARTHAYGEGVHLELQDGLLSSGFAGGDVGFVVDLGGVPLLGAEQEQRGETEETRQQRTFALELQPVVEGGVRSVRAEDLARASALGLTRSAAAIAGHTYLLRAIQSTHSLTVVFTIAQLDVDGATLVWRIVARDGR